MSETLLIGLFFSSPIIFGSIAGLRAIWSEFSHPPVWQPPVVSHNSMEENSMEEVSLFSDENIDEIPQENFNKFDGSFTNAEMVLEDEQEKALKYLLESYSKEMNLDTDQDIITNHHEQPLSVLSQDEYRLIAKTYSEEVALMITATPDNIPDKKGTHTIIGNVYDRGDGKKGLFFNNSVLLLDGHIPEDEGTLLLKGQFVRGNRFHVTSYACPHTISQKSQNDGDVWSVAN